jgi:hypothetical protein
VFERKILRRIYGPVKENESCRIRRNDELEAIIKGENIVRFIILLSYRKNPGYRNPKKDVIWKAVCNKTKRKTKNEMAGRHVQGSEKGGGERMERQNKESRNLEAHCKGGQGPTRAVAPSKKKKKNLRYWYWYAEIHFVVLGSRQRKERLYHIDDTPSGVAEVIQDLDRSHEVSETCTLVSYFSVSMLVY